MPYEPGSKSDPRSSLTFVYEGEFSYRLVCTPLLPNEECMVGRG